MPGRCLPAPRRDIPARVAPTLEAKALKLVGGGDKTPLLVPGKGAVEGVFSADRADAMLGYCSSAGSVARAVPGLAIVPPPPELTVDPAYGMVLLNARPLTLRFAVFIMSEAGQALLRAHGFDPTALAEPSPPSHDLVVQRTGRPPRLLSSEHIATLHAMSQHAAIEHDDREWTGPLLWDVLADAGAVDPGKAGGGGASRRARGRRRWLDRGIRLGRTVAPVRGKADPACRPDERRADPDQALRLIVPDEHRADARFATWCASISIERTEQRP